MHWYDGSIAEAVSLSKQRNSIFVVFVEDDNELSQEMSTALDDATVQKRLADPTNFLAVKLKSGSENYVHFARMYQFVPVPSVFFIGRNGTPLEVVCAGVQPDNLALRIDRILAEHQKGKPSSSAVPNTSAAPNTLDAPPNTSTAPPNTSTAPPNTSAVPPGVGPSSSKQDIKQQTASLLQAEAAKSRERDEEAATSSGPASKVQKTHHEVTASGKQYEVVCDGDVCVRLPRRTDPGPSTASLPDPPHSATAPESTAGAIADAESTDSTDSKLERAMQLIEMKKREKAEKEKELERQKELERRATGQGVAELKRWQADQEMKQLQDERRREKLENQLARQRVLDQIAQDRAERRAREQPSAPEVPTPSAPPSTPTLRIDKQDRRTPRAFDISTSSHRDALPSTASAAAPLVGDGGGRARIQFKLPDGSSHTAHFDAEAPLSAVQRYVADNLQLTSSNFSLWTAFPRRELIAPESSLRELELAPSAALLVLPRRGSSAPVARSTALQTLLSLLSQLVTTIFATPGNLWAWLRGATPPAAPRDPSQPPPAPRAPGLRYRPPTNIHRLTGDHDRPSDDDNNTWNGNSTQQM